MTIDHRERYLKMYFTEEGVIALENRLANLVKLFVSEPKYPFAANVYGFPDLLLKSKEHHEGMIDGLKDILALKKIEV